MKEYFFKIVKSYDVGYNLWHFNDNNNIIRHVDIGKTSINFYPEEIIFPNSWDVKSVLLKMAYVNLTELEFEEEWAIVEQERRRRLGVPRATFDQILPGLIEGKDVFLVPRGAIFSYEDTCSAIPGYNNLFVSGDQRDAEKISKDIFLGKIISWG